MHGDFYLSEKMLLIWYNVGKSWTVKKKEKLILFLTQTVFMFLGYEGRDKAYLIKYLCMVAESFASVGQRTARGYRPDMNAWALWGEERFSDAHFRQERTKWTLYSLPYHIWFLRPLTYQLDQNVAEKPVVYNLLWLLLSDWYFMIF